MSNVGRVLTLVVRIEDDKQSKAIWECHSKNASILGCKITTIADGDATEELEKVEQYLVYLEDESISPGDCSFDEYKEFHA